MITKEEVIEIYKRNGRDAINGNVASALAECMRLLCVRMMEALQLQAKKHDQEIEVLTNSVLQIVQAIDKAASTPVTAAVQRGSKWVCYCGTLVSDGKCEVCGRVA